MLCPNCKESNLTRIDYKNVQLDHCTKCFGTWLDRDELRQVKDKKDEFLKWMDINLWKDETKFSVSKSGRICPVCGVPLYTVKYGESDIEIDLCNLCQGIWLDRRELNKIIKYLKEKVNQESLLGYLKDIGEEFAEVFTGPEKISSEIGDLFMVMKLFEYRLLSQFPKISQIITGLPV